VIVLYISGILYLSLVLVKGVLWILGHVVEFNMGYKDFYWIKV